MPRWLVLLRSLFSGIYTVDNMDFVLRDAYMSGYNTRAFDLERLLHYSFFSPQGLTIHHRGLAALVQFIGVRAELFRAVYFHRTVRAIDLSLGDLFAESKSLSVSRAIHWNTWTPIGALPTGRCWSTWPIGPSTPTRGGASWASRGSGF